MQNSTCVSPDLLRFVPSLLLHCQFAELGCSAVVSSRPHRFPRFLLCPRIWSLVRVAAILSRASGLLFARPNAAASVEFPVIFILPCTITVIHDETSTLQLSSSAGLFRKMAPGPNPRPPASPVWRLLADEEMVRRAVIRARACWPGLTMRDAFVLPAAASSRKRPFFVIEAHRVMW